MHILWSLNQNPFLNPGSLILPCNLRVLLKSYMVSFTFFCFGLSRSSVNRLVVVCSEQCLADDASMDCIYFSFSFSLSGMPPPLLFLSLLLFLSFFGSLISSFMDVYLSLSLTSFSLVCGVACSPEMQAGWHGSRAFHIPLEASQSSAISLKIILIIVCCVFSSKHI